MIDMLFTRWIEIANQCNRYYDSDPPDVEPTKPGERDQEGTVMTTEQRATLDRDKAERRANLMHNVRIYRAVRKAKEPLRELIRHLPQGSGPIGDFLYSELALLLYKNNGSDQKGAGLLELLGGDIGSALNDLGKDLPDLGKTLAEKLILKKDGETSSVPVPAAPRVADPGEETVDDDPIAVQRNNDIRDFLKKYPHLKVQPG